MDMGRETPKIHYSTPWSSTRDFGGAINNFCKLVPDGDWVCIRDGDTCFLTPDWGAHLEAAVDRWGNQYSLLGCMTNRVGVVDQLSEGRFSNEFDIKKLEAEAKELHRTQYLQVKEVELTSGLLMLFPKSLWREVGGFPRNTKLFDRKFCEKVRKKGHRIGIIEGLYLYHHYRVHYPTLNSAIKQSKHLGKR